MCDRKGALDKTSRMCIILKAITLCKAKLNAIFDRKLL